LNGIGASVFAPCEYGCADGKCFEKGYSTICPSGWQYFSQIDKCLFNGYNIKLNFTSALTYCENLSGYLASSGELNSICDNFEIGEMCAPAGSTDYRKCIGGARVTDIYPGGHKIWHDKGFHYTSDYCGDVIYNECGTTITGNAVNCPQVDLWATDSAPGYGLVCLKQPCTDLCTAGTKMCSRNGFQTCGDWNGDGCTEYGPITYCPAGQECVYGECKTIPCKDECFPDGEKRCRFNALEKCGNYDADSCLEWSKGEICKSGMCMNDKECAPVPELSPPSESIFERIKEFFGRIFV